MGALDGIRVLDASQVLAGPFSAQLMADSGADVIRVESTEGDLCRGFPPERGGQSTTFLTVNRGKRGIALNLKTPEARSVLHGLAARADIMIQSFLPARAKGFGLDYEAIRAINPNIVHVTISGYGSEGPLKDKAGLDMMVSAFTGIMSMTGDPDRPPVRVGSPVIDMSTGMIAYGAAMTALVARMSGKGGQAVNVSLMETALNLLAFNATNWLTEGQIGKREGSGFLRLAPYEALQCADGHILVGAASDSAWRRVCAALEAPGLAEEARFRSNADRVRNRPAMRAAIEAILKTRPATEWIARFDAAGAVAAPIHTVDEVFQQEQVTANRMIVERRDRDGSTLRTVGTPFKLSGTPPEPGAAAPHLGEHTDAILRDELGMSASEIATLREKGAIR
ncbi:MAG: CaiB/BaiF CoA transferase family protein [Alphaproteobacteria bacterium]